jgi:hypothetical protein
MDPHDHPPARDRSDKKPGTRLLLLSDTHGALAQIDELAARGGAAAGVDAGGLGV